MALGAIIFDPDYYNVESFGRNLNRAPPQLKKAQMMLFDAFHLAGGLPPENMTTDKLKILADNFRRFLNYGVYHRDASHHDLYFGIANFRT